MYSITGMGGFTRIIDTQNAPPLRDHIPGEITPERINFLNLMNRTHITSDQYFPAERCLTYEADIIT